MPIRIFNNTASVNAQNLLGQNNNRLSNSVERISSGLRINKAADDAAGLAISEGLRSDIRTLRQAVRNSNDGVSLINIAEGALNEQGGMLIRLRELASQAATGTTGSTERATIQLEFNALRNEIDRITHTTVFNDQKLIDGSLASSVSSANQIFIQVGMDNNANSRINLNEQLDLKAITVSALNIDSLSVTGSSGALDALEAINTAIGSVTAIRGQVGSCKIDLFELFQI